MAKLVVELTIWKRWWWSWFLLALTVYVWCLHRIVLESYLDSVIDRAAEFGARRGYKIGLR